MYTYRETKALGSIQRAVNSGVVSVWLDFLPVVQLNTGGFGLAISTDLSLLIGAGPCLRCFRSFEI